MAHPNSTLIQALRTCAQRLSDGARYAWGHHGHCNCGNLAQVLTTYSVDEIDRYVQAGAGEWTEVAQAWCPGSHAPVDMVIASLIDAGLTPGDIHHLEYLSDKSVLRHLPGGFRWLKRNRRDDVVLYLCAFADLLENQLLDGAVRNALEALTPAEVADTLAGA